MKMSVAFPSKYIAAADLQGRQVDVEIERVEMEDIGDDHKPVAYFVGKSKGLVLNKTNASAIADLYGDETDAWIGRVIIIFPTKTDFNGRRVDAVRIMAPRSDAPLVAAPPRQQTIKPAAQNSPVIVDDSIPF